MSCQATWTNESYQDLNDCFTAWAWQSRNPKYLKETFTLPDGTKVPPYNPWADTLVTAYCDNFRKRHCGQWFNPASGPPVNDGYNGNGPFQKSHWWDYFVDQWKYDTTGIPDDFEHLGDNLWTFVTGAILPNVPWWVWLILFGILGLWLLSWFIR